MGDCDNTNCCYYLDGKCNGARDGYTIENCDERFIDNDIIGLMERSLYVKIELRNMICKETLLNIGKTRQPQVEH